MKLSGREHSWDPRLCCVVPGLSLRRYPRRKADSQRDETTKKKRGPRCWVPRLVAPSPGLPVPLASISAGAWHCLAVGETVPAALSCSRVFIGFALKRRNFYDFNDFPASAGQSVDPGSRVIGEPSLPRTLSLLSILK